jgi:hypothetical protein
MTIEKVSKKDGTISKGKNIGKKWYKTAFLFNTKWYGFFHADWNRDLQDMKEGDEVEVNVEEKDGFLNIVEGETNIKTSTDKTNASEELLKLILDMKERIKMLEDRMKVVEDSITIPF